jgi:simple sugar transport system permease protein
MNEILASTLRLSTPLLFAAMGGFLAERSGIATICLEGVMLAGAWTAATVTYFTHNPWLGLLAGIGMGALAMSLHAFLTVTARADQIVSGVAVNILVAGLTPLFTKTLFGSPTNTGEIPLDFRLPPTWLIASACLLPLVLHWAVYRTGLGLRLLAAGDGPDALRTAGVSPSLTRYAALFLAGAVTALGGIYLSTSHASSFTRDMTAGRGFIALTALIFGGWRPIPTLFACLFFGLTDALQINLQSISLGGYTVPVQFIQALPYLVTLLVLVVIGSKARPPRAIGKEI